MIDPKKIEELAYKINAILSDPIDEEVPRIKKVAIMVLTREAAIREGYEKEISEIRKSMRITRMD